MKNSSISKKIISILEFFEWNQGSDIFTNFYLESLLGLKHFSRLRLKCSSTQNRPVLILSGSWASEPVGRSCQWLINSKLAHYIYKSIAHSVAMCLKLLVEWSSVSSSFSLYKMLLFLLLISRQESARLLRRRHHALVRPQVRNNDPQLHRERRAWRKSNRNYLWWSGLAFGKSWQGAAKHNGWHTCFGTPGLIPSIPAEKIVDTSEVNHRRYLKEGGLWRENVYWNQH